MSEPSDTQCAACCAPTTKKCAGCKVRAYCSKACQTKDWPTHKKICSDLKLEHILGRAAALIQDAYLSFRKNTWSDTIKKVEDREDALIIHDGDPWESPQGFVKFPDDIVPDNKRARLGVLTAWRCDEPCASLATLIEKLLHGLKIDIEELGVLFKTVPRKTTAVHYTRGEPHSNWPDCKHVMLRVKSRKSDKQWVLDVTGAQYGIVEVLHDWSKYEHDYVDKVVGVYQLGAHRRILTEVAKGAGMATLSYGLIGRAAVVLDKALTKWETQNQSVSHIRALADTAFAEKKASLLDTLDTAVPAFNTTNDFTDLVCKAKADDSGFTQHMTKMRIDSLTAEANLLLRYPRGKPTMMDRLREKFGPDYTYRDGDEYCLPVDEVLEFYDEEFNQPVERKYVYDEKNKVHHYSV